MKLTRLFDDFVHSEKTGGIILIVCTIVSLLLANCGFADGYVHFWHTPVAGAPVEYWINDGLMAIFFLLIGLELEREVYIGELSNIKDAALPIFGALGGMLVPAGIFLMLNMGLPTQSGAGIPMATDIAFALGILSLLGKRVPTSLKIFLTALAVIDDLGAILVIALFYTKNIVFENLFIAIGIFIVLLALNRLKVRNLIPYLAGGIAMWYFMLHSGVHATITGVLVAFAIPFGNGGPKSTSYILQHFLHRPVSFIILPLFAMANTAIILSPSSVEAFSEHFGLGIVLGLIVGKPLGIFLFAFAAVSLGFCKLPNDMNWKLLFGVGLLGGIGFTMSIFIALLAFDDASIISNSKFVIMAASVIAGIAGFLYLKYALKKHQDEKAV